MTLLISIFFSFNFQFQPHALTPLHKFNSLFSMQSTKPVFCDFHDVEELEKSIQVIETAICKCLATKGDIKQYMRMVSKEIVCMHVLSREVY